VFTPKRNQLFRHCSGRAWDWQRRLSAVFVFVLLVSAAGQDVGGNAGTNQPGTQIVPTNTLPAQPLQTPATPPSDIEALESLTNQFGQLVNPPPQLGPAAVGAPAAAAPLMGRSVFGGPPGGGGPVVTGAGIPLWGPIDMHPRLSYTFTDGNGIQSEPGEQAVTVVNTVTPGVLLNVGQHWSIDYSPSFTFYSNPEFKNAVDETVFLRGFWAYEDWTLSLSQGYVSSSDPLVETGTQTTQEGYATAISASHQMNDNLSLDLGVNQNFRLAQEFTDLYEWTTSDWLDYKANKMFGMGLGVTLGYDDESVGSDMPFESLQGRISFNPGPKLSISLSGGISDRQFINPSSPPLLSPVYSGTLTYQLFKPTLLSVTASRSVNPSYFSDQVEVDTSYAASLSQQISKKMSFSLSGSYNTTPSSTIQPGPLPQFFIGPPPNSTLTVVRNDTTTSFQAGLSYTISSHASLSVFYSLSDNSSGQAEFAYSSRQIGFSLSYQY